MKPVKPLTDKECLALISERLIEAKRQELRTLARLKALESIVRSEVPKARLKAWDKLLDEQTNRILQHYLEAAENKEPWLAGKLDNRGDDELTGLDVPLPLA